MNALKKITIAVSLSAAFMAAPAFAEHNANPHAAIPHLDHVFLIMMENHGYSQILNNTNAPFINQMAKSANLATNYFAVGHPSLTNYLEVVGGSNFGIENDNYPNWHNATPSANLNDPIPDSGMDAETPANIAPFGIKVPAAPFVGETIADQLVAVGKSWKSYQESLPASGVVDGVNLSDGIYSNLSDASITSSGNLQKLYAVKHNPFAYFANVQEATDPNNSLNNVADFSGINGLYADLRAGEAPNFSFIAPNQCHDMHGIGNGSPLCNSDATLVQMGDASIKQLVSAIKASRSWKEGKNAIIVMWDENDFSASPNQVVTIVDTNYGVKGVMSNQPYSHFSLLKTLDAGFGLPCLNHACDSNVNLMSDMFKAARNHHRDND
jgi:hypothetical protein